MKFLDTAPLAKTRNAMTYGAAPSLKPAAPHHNIPQSSQAARQRLFPSDNTRGKLRD